ncbi:G-rich sequence factor 1 [Nerophis ophidion]|uniref:G-rich sequence factor 1 n=1 Tax=Nerophis ophidion TaxID=159077 RepID=UPI002AE097F9|nr:G-rich sequence factor 1 [Nerophis ophidion]XP_061751865.1 G-rich sequence factor 1 [Nerophis ophidion]
MSRSCRSALALFHRCVAASHVTPSAAVAARCGFVPSSTLTSKTRTDFLPGLQVAVRRSLCSKAPFGEEKYPPLPAYQAGEQPEKKDVYIVQVQGLPWTCTAEDVVGFFSECRIREGVSGVHMTVDTQGRPSGHAFVELENEEDVKRALEKHRQYLGPRYVEVSEITDSDAEEILKKATVSPDDSRVVRIRGIPFSCTEKDIVLFFSGLDIVENGITMIKNRRGRNTGEAFVRFATQQAADEALQRDRQLIWERYIEVFASTGRELQSRWTNLSPPSSDITKKRVSPLHPLHTGPVAAPRRSKTSRHYVHLRGLSFRASGEDIVKFFSPLSVSMIRLELGPNGRPSGEADVYFDCHEDAVAAMSHDRMNIGERYIELFLNSDSDYGS